MKNNGLTLTFAVACAVICIAACIAFFGTSLNPMLAWLRLNNGPLQAVAAILAIAVGAFVAWWVPRSATVERRSFLRRASASNLAFCADAIGQMGRLLTEETAGIQFALNGRGNRIQYDISHYRSLLLTFPAAELADHEIQSRMLKMQNCIVRTEAVLAWYNETGMKNADKAAASVVKIYKRSCEIAGISPIEIGALKESEVQLGVDSGT